MPHHHLRIGASGWSYPTGRGRWTGIFYPTAGRARRPTGFDELAYYAEHFDTVEVNASFYRVPAPGVTRRWVERTPEGFEFSLKLYQKFTHPEMYSLSTGSTETAIRPADLDLMRAALDPIRDADRLGALLAQFPPSFHSEPSTREYLDRLLGCLADYPTAVELRHRSWSDDVGSTLALLGEHNAAWVQIDEPKFRFSIAQSYLPNVRGCFYMRLHGRNARQWWTHDQAEDRYDYLYTASELRPFAEAAEAAGPLVRKRYLYLNNHFAAKAVANAVVLKHQLGQEIPGTYPAEFVDRYPEVADLVTHEPGRSRLPLDL